MLGLDQLRTIPEREVAAAVFEAVGVLEIYTNPDSDYHSYLQAKKRIDMEPPFGLNFPSQLWLAERALYDHSLQHGYIEEADLQRFADKLFKWKNVEGRVIGTDKERGKALDEYKRLFGKMAGAFEKNPTASKIFGQLASLGNAALYVPPRQR